MRTIRLLAAYAAAGCLFATNALADGGTNKGGFAVRSSSGPTDSKLVGKEPAPKPAINPNAPSNMNAASGSAPPVAPLAAEEPAPTPNQSAAVGTQDANVQPAAAPGGPFWENRWFWALLALLLLLGAGGIEYFGRKRDERLAAEEPDDAPASA